MPFTHDNARAMRARLQGLHRAEFWRTQNWENLRRATAVFVANCARRRAEKAKAKALKPYLDSTREI